MSGGSRIFLNKMLALEAPVNLGFSEDQSKINLKVSQISSFKYFEYLEGTLPSSQSYNRARQMFEDKSLLYNIIPM